MNSDIVHTTVQHGRPVQIIEVDGDTGTFRLKNEELRSILLQEKVKDKPVAVVSIAGDFRKGKSFLLNLFVRYLQKKDNWLVDKDEPLRGFSWRGGHERDTSGILMWSKPFITKRKDGREIAILLMDTQGTFDNKTTVKENATIFAISTMTSSIQIFNLLHNMQEDNLQMLEAFLEYGRIAQKSVDAKPFQRLMFLIRDWSYPYEYEYGIGGGQHLLEEQLKVTSKQRPQLQRVRKNINSCFSHIGCFLLPHPGPKVATNPNFDGRVSDIDPEFVQNMEQLMYQLLAPDNIVVKQVSGRDLTGAQLLEYFIVYTAGFNGENIPEPTTMLEATAEANNLVALQRARNFYEGNMKKFEKEGISVSLQILEKKHFSFKQAALDIFEKSPKLGGQNERSKMYYERLVKEIGNAYEYYKSVMEERTKQKKAAKYKFFKGMVQGVFIGLGAKKGYSLVRRIL
ncbi:atlastin GTPase [Brevipalpus obovatus]|uniref:atlastin GTPase n=1 Tax=Brevipalpus obovatus TaxID=246614 RepID=UPI003D9E561F